VVVMVSAEKFVPDSGVDRSSAGGDLSARRDE
jgi:hypothetical protein